MLCPFCKTENRDERETCYYCNKDLSMLRLIVNKSKHHYNLALEHAERGRYPEAIVELKNAIDLNSSYVNAYVVLGTIYAKMEEYDNAIEQWNKALNLDNKFLKVHEYLEKAQASQKGKGGINSTIRNMALGLVACVCIIFILSFILFKQPKDYLLTKEAYDFYKNGNYSKAVSLSEKIYNNTDDDIILFVSKMIKETIDKDTTHVVNQIKIDIEKQDFAGGFKKIDELTKLNPDNATKVKIEFVRRKLSEAYSKKIENEIKKFDNSDKSFEKLQASIKEYKSFVKKSNETKSVDKLFNKIKDQLIEKRLAVVVDEYKKNNDFASTMKSLKTLKSDYQTTKSSAMISAFSSDILKKRYDNLSQEIKKSLDLNNYKNIYSSFNNLNEFSKVYEEFFSESLKKEKDAFVNKIITEIVNKQTNSVSDDIKNKSIVSAQEKLIALEKFVKENNVQSEDVIKLKESIEANKSLAYIAELQMLYDSGKYNEILKLESDAVKSATEEERKIIDNLKNKAKGKIALEYWDWYLSQDISFTKGKIDETSAKLAIERYDFTLQNLPKSYYYAKDNITFYAASSYEKVGNKEEAIKLYNYIITEYSLTAYASLSKEKLAKINK